MRERGLNLLECAAEQSTAKVTVCGGGEWLKEQTCAPDRRKDFRFGASAALGYFPNLL